MKSYCTTFRVSAVLELAPVSVHFQSSTRCPGGTHGRERERERERERGGGEGSASLPSASREGDTEFDSRFPRSSLTIDFKICTPVAALLAAWRIDSALGLVGPVSVYCDRVRQSLIDNFVFRVAAR